MSSSKKFAKSKSKHKKNRHEKSKKSSSSSSSTKNNSKVFDPSRTNPSRLALKSTDKNFILEALNELQVLKISRSSTNTAANDGSDTNNGKKNQKLYQEKLHVMIC